MVAGQADQKIAQHLARFGGLEIQVYLFVIEGAPQFFARAVGTLDDGVRRPGFARVDFGQQFFVDLAVGAEFGEGQKHVRVFRRGPFFEIVFEKNRLARNVVDHEIDDQVEIAADDVHVLPGSESRVHFVVGQRRETAIGRGGIKRQQMHAADAAAQVAPQHEVQFGQIGAQAVGIGDQLDFILQAHVLLPVAVDASPRR